MTALLPYLLQLIKDATGSKWGPLMILVSSWVVQLLTQDSKFPISLPAKWNSNVWKPVVVLLASTAQAIVVSIIQQHVDPVHAILLGLRTAMWTLGLWALVIKAIYNGKPPKWMDYLAFILPKPQAASRAAAALDEDELEGLDELNEGFPKPPPPPKE